VTGTEIWNLIVGAIQGVGIAAFLSAILFGGICVPLTLLKFRSTRNTRTIKSLDERVGAPIVFLPPDAPRGPIDQLGGARRPA